MTSVKVYTVDKMKEIEAANIVDAALDASNHLILTKFDGTTLDLGLIQGSKGDTGSIQNASHDIPGLVQLATASDVATGTDDSKVITPLAIASAMHRPIGQVRLSTASSVGLAVVVPYATVVLDPDSMFDTTNHWFVAPKAGYYYAKATVKQQSTAANFLLELYHGPPPAATEYMMGTHGYGTQYSGSEVKATIYCNAGDAVKAVIRGTGITTTGTPTDNQFDFIYLRP